MSPAKRAKRADPDSVTDEDQAVTPALGKQRSRAAGSPSDPPPIPLPFKVLGIVGILAVILGGIWFGIRLAGGGTETPNYGWEMAPPPAVGAYATSGIQSIEPREDEPWDEVVQAEYSDGESKFILEMARPASDIDSFMAEAATNDVQSVSGSQCGVLVDNGAPICAEIKDDTAIAIVGLSGQSPDELSDLISEFYDVLKG